MRFRISSYKDNLLEIRGINTLWVLSGRPQTRRTPALQALHTFSTWALVISQITHPYKLQQYDMSNLILVTLSSVLKKHRTLLIWLTKAERPLLMSCLSSKSLEITWPRWVVNRNHSSERRQTYEQTTNRQTDGHWYTGRWWVGCYIWYSEEGPRRAAAPPSPLLAVPITAHPSTASLPTSHYSTWQEISIYSFISP